jgi:two-component system nitrate/nitrite response regulator NarL
MNPILVILIEDQLLLSQSLAASLRSRLSVSVIGEYCTIETVQKAGAELRKASVALVDIKLGSRTAFELVSGIKQMAPALRCIWMTCVEEDYLLEAAFAANLPGFVHKEDSLDVLFTAIETVAAGGRYYSESIVQRRRAQRSDPEHFSRILSPREQEVLKLIGAGMSNFEAAAILGLSAGTLQAHRRNIMARLDLHSAAELQAYALRFGFADQKQLKVPSLVARPTHR